MADTGDKKTKFQPKVPLRRLRKVGDVKSEPGTGTSDGAIQSELQKLVQQAQEAANKRGSRPSENKAGPTRVAFGFSSSTAGKAPVGIPGYRTKKSRGGGSGGGGGATTAKKKDETVAHEVDKENQSVGVFHDDKKTTKQETFDTMDESAYYPISLPLRKPVQIAEEYFEGSEDEDMPFDEDAIPPARELGLLAPTTEEKLLFFQIPSLLPLRNSANSGSSAPIENEDNANNEAAGPPVDPTTSLDKLKGGSMGKLRVYESGAVKLHLGDVVLNVSPGVHAFFAQELAAINSSTNTCCFLGDVGQRVVLTPDMESFLKKGS